MKIRDFNLPEEQKVIKYLKTINYPGYYKDNICRCWPIDQKCTYDVLHVNCKCIMNMVNNNKITEFTSDDFANDEYSSNICQAKTAKNGKAPISKRTKREYDKFFWNIFELLSYTEVLAKNKTPKKYVVKNLEIIELLSSSEEACVAFICHVVYNLLTSQGLIIHWEKFVNSQCNGNYKNNDHFKTFRKKYDEWITTTTKHKSDINQIFYKFVNPLYYLYQLKKFHPVKCSKSLLQSVNDMAYFRKHPRDYSKTIGMTRAEHKDFVNLPINSLFRDNLSEFNQKNLVKKWNQEFYDMSGNNYCSELNGEIVITGIDVHHIWPKNEFDETSPISPNVCENMIVLDQKQHHGYAHVQGSTREINKNCLNMILWKQFEKIQNFNARRVGKYNLKTLYELVCFIKSIIPSTFSSEEILIGYIEDIISL